MGEIVCSRKVKNLWRPNKQTLQVRTKYLCFRHILHIWFQQIFSISDHVSCKWDGQWWINPVQTVHHESTPRHIGTHILIKKGLYIMYNPNPIIMYACGWITRLLYVVIKSSPFFVKCLFGFMPFNPHWTIDIYDLFELHIKCLCLINLPGSALHALHAVVEKDTVFLLICRCVHVRGTLRMSNPLPDLTHLPLFEQPHLAAPSKCWH